MIALLQVTVSHTALLQRIPVGLCFKTPLGEARVGASSRSIRTVGWEICERKETATIM
jgi:hypothetical protein